MHPRWGSGSWLSKKTMMTSSNRSSSPRVARSDHYSARTICSRQSPNFDKLHLFTTPDCSGTPIVINQKRGAGTCLQFPPPTPNSMRLTCFRETADCNPANAMNEAQCLAKRGFCALSSGRDMKWTGPGCRDRRGRLLQDGGCQCLGYCGYKCKAACNRDPFNACAWNDERGVCTYKDGGADGFPMDVCPQVGGRPGKDLLPLSGNMTELLVRLEQLRTNAAAGGGEGQP